MAPPRYRYHDTAGGGDEDQDFLEAHYEANIGRITRTEISDAVDSTDNVAGPSSAKQHTSAHTRSEAEPSTSRKVASAATSGQSDAVSSSQPTDIEMGLPGTAKGQGGSGDGNASSGMPLYTSVVPHTQFNNKTTTYRKVHRLMSFGLAHTFLNGTTGSPLETQKFLMTYLAEIPWHKPYFYMTPGEYNILGPNAKCKSVRISVVHRGNRIAFETASSATGLATLNNIQNIAVAYGLNKTGFGVNVRPNSFVTNEPMRVQNFATDENNQPYINSWYGFSHLWHSGGR